MSAWSSLWCEKLVARPGKGAALIALLQRGAGDPHAAGGPAYAVQASSDDPDVVWVTRVRTSQDSDAPAALRQALALAGPLLADGHEPTADRDRVA